MKHLLASLALAGAVLAPAALAAPDAASAILGEWRGRYVCGQGVTALTLTISAAPKGQLAALFDFGPLKENPTVPHGSYEMRGRFDAKSRRLRLAAGKWILQPGGYFTVDLDGYLSRKGEEITGVVPAAGCTVFDLERAVPLIS